MSTPHDARRRTAFRGWVNYIGGIDAAIQQTGIARRTIERMYGGRQTPPVRLLEELGNQLTSTQAAPAIAAALLDAARARETASA